MAALTLIEIRDAVSSGLVTCAAAPLDGDVSSWDADFQSQWYRANDIVGAAFRTAPPSVEIQTDADALRSAIFQQILSTTGDDTLAVYTGDDFHFIINAALLGVDDPWISALWQTYRNGRSPYIEAT